MAAALACGGSPAWAHGRSASDGYQGFRQDNADQADDWAAADSDTRYERLDGWSAHGETRFTEERYLGWGVRDERAFDERGGYQSGRGEPGDASNCPVRPGERVLECRYVAFDRPVEDETVDVSDQAFDGGVGPVGDFGGGGGWGGGGWGGGGWGRGFATFNGAARGDAFASASASAFASARADVNVSISGGQFHHRRQGGGRRW